MKRVFLLTGLLQICCLAVFAKQVDEQTAKQVGQAFLSGTAGTKQLKSGENFTLVYKAAENSSSKQKSQEQTTYFYVFNAETDGFVIVAGDDKVSPILGYSPDGCFDPENMPINLMKWLDGYKNEIRYVVEHDISATEEVRKEWEDYYNGVTPKVQKANSVAPLLQTQWNQNPYYNDLCPGNANNKTVTGCVATAMAQVMKYWNYPPIGTSFRSYNHPVYGTLSANFGATTYNWSSMPIKLTSSSSSTEKNAVATLMYHCGVSVNMQYATAAAGGSGAYTTGSAPSAEHALKTYFGYKNTLSGKSKSSYTNVNWINLLKTELEAGRPILYAGTGTSGGHAFVCDGFNENDYFHFNWGWGGQNDGYYALTLLKPGSGGAGGGSYDFTSNQRAIIGIEPSQSVWNDTSTAHLRLYSGLSMAASLRFGDTIRLTVSIANYDTATFKGTLGAAVFNSEGILVDFFDTISVSMPDSTYTSPALSFVRRAMPPFIPGNYSVAIYYKTSDKDWTIVGDGNAYGQRNEREFTIEYSAQIETYSAFSIKNNGGRLISKEPVTINVNILNYSSSDFYGKFRVSLSNIDGTSVQTIKIIDLDDFQKKYLTAWSYYTEGIDFTGTITASAGTYLMELAYQRKGETAWYYAGSSDYQNPIFVIVEAPIVYPDKYEPNDTYSQAYSLPVVFSGNKASVKTTGSNFHTGTDQDYYKIELPAGYDYTITATLYDSDNKGSGDYSVDGVFSYSTDNGNTWSEPYDDVMPGNISVENGGNVYFHVSPYFAGIGTYLLDISISRTTTGIEQLTMENGKLKIYPNPTTGQLTINNEQLTIEKIEIYDVVGQLLYQINKSTNKQINNEISIDVSHLASGMYFLKVGNKVVRFVKE